MPDNSRQKFEKDKSGAVQQPPPRFPRLPEEFVSRYEPKIQAVLNQYSDDCQKWLEKLLQGQQ